MKATQFREKYGDYALVAGGSIGLGAAFSEEIASRGLNLVLIARQEDKLRSLAVKLKETYKIDVIYISADLADMKM